jgi:hypothetical protein
MHKYVTPVTETVKPGYISVKLLYKCVKPFYTAVADPSAPQSRFPVAMFYRKFPPSFASYTIIET